MAIKQPLKKENITDSSLKSEFSNALVFPSNIASKDTEDGINNISSSVIFFFNSLEDSNTAFLKAQNANYYDWSGDFTGDVPLKNSAWQNQRKIENDLNLQKISSDSVKAAKSINENVKNAQENIPLLTPGGAGLASAGAAYIANNSDMFVSKIDEYLNRKYKRTDKAIHLLSPTSIQYQTSAGWQNIDFELNAMGLLGTGLLSEEKGRIVSTLARESMDLVDIVGEGGKIGDAITKSVINPYTQQTFQGMNRRSFQFNWELVPKNETELNMIDRIITLFRFHAHPSLSTVTGTGSNYLNFPGQIDIEWYFKDPETGELIENYWLPRISTCVIESITTDYSPHGHFSFFKNTGAPTQINLSIQVKEIHPLLKEDIAQGR